MMSFNFGDILTVNIHTFKLLEYGNLIIKNSLFISFNKHRYRHWLSIQTYLTLSQS